MNRYAIIETLTALTFLLASAPAFAVRDAGGTPIPPPSRPPTVEQLKELVDKAMPTDVKEDNRGLLAALLKPQVAPTGPSDRFDMANAGRVLRLRRATPGKGCFLPPPAYDCTVSDGSRGGGGAYKELHADSVGNLRFISRLADPSKGDPEGSTAPDPQIYSKEDQAARKAFFDLFTDVFALPPGEAPALDSWQVHKLALGLADPERGVPQKVFVVAGVVSVPRLVPVQGLSTPAIPVHGSQIQGSMDNAGIFRVEVDDWTRFTMPERLFQATAPSRSALVQTIAEDLSKSLDQLPGAIDVDIVYAKGSHFEELALGGATEDERPGASAPGDGVPDEHRYVPVLLTTVTPTPADASETEQAQRFSSAGLEMVTPLFEVQD